VIQMDEGSFLLHAPDHLCTRLVAEPPEHRQPAKVGMIFVEEPSFKRSSEGL
jgi:hypothetical protein